MKKNTSISIWAILIAFSMLFLTISNGVSAGEFDATVIASRTVKNSAEQPIKRVAVFPKKGSIVDLTVSGKVPGVSQVFSHLGEPESNALSCSKEEDYPAYFGSYMNDASPVRRLNDVKYVTIQNNTDQFGDYEVRLSTHVAGRVGMGKTITVQPNKYLTEVELDINKVGPVSITYDKAGTNLIRIRDPDGNIVSFLDKFDSTSTGIMQKAIFISPKKGIYSAYFEFTQKYVNVRLDSEKTSGYKLGDVINYEDKVGNIGDLRTVANRIVESYDFDVKAGQAISVYFKTLSKIQSVFLSFPVGVNDDVGDVDYYNMPLYNTDGSIIPMIFAKDGKAYLTIVRLEPYNANSMPNAFRFAISPLEVEDFAPDSMKRITVTPTGVDSLRLFKVEVANPGTLLFNHTVIQYEPNIAYVDFPDGFLFYSRNGTFRSQASLSFPDPYLDHSYYHVQPGSYYFFIDSTTDEGNGIVDMQIRYIADTAIDLVETTGPMLLETQLKKYTLENMRNDTAGYGSTFMKVFKFTAPFAFDFSSIVDIRAADNSAFFASATTLAAIYQVEFFYDSPYDGVYSISSGLSGKGISIGSGESNSHLFGSEYRIFKEQTFYVSLVLFNLRDGANSSNIITSNITINFGVGQRNSAYLFKSYNMAANTANKSVDPNQFTGYDDSVSVDGKLISMLIWEVTGAKQFDWIQINLQRLQGDSEFWANIFFDAPWYDFSTDTVESYSYGSLPTGENRTIEIGALTSTFYICIKIVPANPDVNVTNKIWVGGYDIEVIRFDLPAGGLAPWQIVLIVVGVIVGVAAIVVGVVYYRKKKLGRTSDDILTDHSGDKWDDIF